MSVLFKNRVYSVAGLYQNSSFYVKKEDHSLCSTSFIDGFMANIRPAIDIQCFEYRA